MTPGKGVEDQPSAEPPRDPHEELVELLGRGLTMTTLEQAERVAAIAARYTRSDPVVSAFIMLQADKHFEAERQQVLLEAQAEERVLDRRAEIVKRVQNRHLVVVLAVLTVGLVMFLGAFAISQYLLMAMIAAGCGVAVPVTHRVGNGQLAVTTDMFGGEEQTP